MSTLDKGKHCNVCQKSVIDFTSMSGNEIMEYLNSKKTERVCGRFLTSQVMVKRTKSHEVLIELYERTENNSNIRFFNQFSLFIIIACMLVVGCDIPKNVEKQTIVEIEKPIKKEVVKDSIVKENYFTMGAPSFPTEEIKCTTDKSESKNTNKNKEQQKQHPPIEEMIMGDIEFNIDNLKEETLPNEIEEIIIGKPFINQKRVNSKDSLENN
jgi:hypothetical protein